MAHARTIDPQLSKDIIRRLNEAKNHADVEKEIQWVESLNFFDGYWRVGEFYKNGRNSFADKQTVKLDKEKASDYFIKARRAYEEATKGQLQVTVNGEKASPLSDHDSITLEKINNLLKKATSGNPESLFQLACFYRQELESKPEKRKINAMDADLKQWSKACLEASANLYHPHAAMMLASEEKDLEMKLKFSEIAADPATAIHNALVKNQLRDPTSPVRNPIDLQAANNVTPQELFVRVSISASNRKISGIFAATGTTKGDCMLPKQHTAPILGQTTGVSQSNVSKADMMEARLRRFTGNSSSEAKKANAPVAKEVPAKVTPVGRLAFIAKVESAHKTNALTGLTNSETAVLCKQYRRNFPIF
jgi:hypothetical protein